MNTLTIKFETNPLCYYDEETENVYYFKKDFDRLIIDIDGVEYKEDDFEIYVSDEGCSDCGEGVEDDWRNETREYIWEIDNDNITKDDIKLFCTDDICGNWLVIKDKPYEIDQDADVYTCLE